MISFSAGGIFLSGICYYITDWKDIYIYVFGSGAIALNLSHFFMVESPR